MGELWDQQSGVAGGEPPGAGPGHGGGLSLCVWPQQQLHGQGERGGEAVQRRGGRLLRLQTGAHTRAVSVGVLC